MFRFTIRNVLWVTVLVAMTAGWWAGHRRYQPVFEIMTSGLEPRDRFEVNVLSDGRLVGKLTKAAELGTSGPAKTESLQTASTTKPSDEDGTAMQVIKFRVTKANDHLGHNTTSVGGKS